MSRGKGAYLGYDGLGRLILTTNAAQTATTYFDYDGSQLLLERASGGGAIQRRYVYGPPGNNGPDDNPIVWYEGAGLTDKRYMMSDERGSITSITDGGGALLGINRYDEYGIPASTNMGRFGYTGQTWLPEIGMNYYKARIYSPTLGRFMQADPIGYGDGMNWYNYVSSDPVNGRDPTGLLQVIERCYGGGSYTQIVDGVDTSFVTGRVCEYSSGGGGGTLDLGRDFIGGRGIVSDGGGAVEVPLVVTGTRRRKNFKTPKDSVTISVIDPFVIASQHHYGNGETVCLSDSQFSEVARGINRVSGDRSYYSDGSYSASASLSGYDLEYSLGTTNFYFDSLDRPIGLFERIDYRGSGRGFKKDAATYFGRAYSALTGGKDYYVQFPCL